MSDKIGLLTGSFDPVTLGHLDVIKRAGQLFDQLYIGIFYNREKQGFFTIEDRQFMLEEALAELDNVKVITADNALAVDVAKQVGATYLVRGLRNATDFDYEANLAFFNKGLAEDLETIYLIASHEVQPISSSRVRELIYFGADLSRYVPESVIKVVEKRSETRKND